MKNADMPAMPVDGQQFMSAERSGLTKREYFAAMAMSGYCSESEGWDESAQEVARCSVAMADALLAELERTK